MIYPIEPVSFGFRPAAECLEQNGAEGVYLRFGPGMIERLSMPPKDGGRSVRYEMYHVFNRGGYSFSAALNPDGSPVDDGLAEVFLSVLQTGVKNR